MEREIRYYVAKISDADKALSKEEIFTLNHLLQKIQTHRIVELNKPLLKCVVVESDWPEYEPTWAAIEERVTRENAQKGG